jgi:sugar phosphate isomerase/epimerase
MLEILDTNEKLRSCFDTNHLLIEDPVHYVKAVGSRIITTHVSDYDFVDEKHWWPGEGKLNYTAVLNALREVGFAGTWMYEVNLTIGDRTELCAAVLDNAMRAFRGEFCGGEKMPQE